MNQMIKERLALLADEKYRLFQSGLLPGVDGILGVRLPDLRLLAAELSKPGWKQYLAEAKDDSFEEIMLQGMVIGLASDDIDETLKFIEHFVPKINNWAVCDSFCGGLKIARNHQQQFWDFLQPYFLSKKEFDRRFAVVMLLCHFIDDLHIDLVLARLDQISYDGYYVKMAVAWAISICFVHFPDKTMGLLSVNNLDDFTYNKSLQKITESLRVDMDTKAVLRQMKRKTNAVRHSPA